MAFTDDDLKRLKEAENALARSFGIPAFIVRSEAAEKLLEYAEHNQSCILSFAEAGEPTPDGGYRTKYAGKWYQTKPVDETPECDCGLTEKANAWAKAAGK